MFGLLWEWSGEFESLYVMLHHFRAVSRWHSRVADGSHDMVHQWQTVCGRLSVETDYDKLNVNNSRAVVDSHW